MSEPLIRIGIAGSTERTAQCAQAISIDQRFQISWVLTPTPKPIGRKKTIQPNPLHQFATNNSIAIVQISKRIDSEIKQQVQKLSEIDMLLVVDFGYIVPEWLLTLPKIAPVNIHPSLLPRWRGSSPGQFVLLYGERDSAVTVMTMNDKLDEGDIITQIPFSVEPSWDQKQYYEHAFGLVSTQLADILHEFANGKLTPKRQPDSSPTIIAGRLRREDGFIDWEVLKKMIEGSDADEQKLSQVIQGAISNHASLAATIVAAHKAFFPWPGLWTIVTTNKGQQRMKILSCIVAEDDRKKLILEIVQLEGKPIRSWSQTKSLVLN